MSKLVNVDVESSDWLRTVSARHQSSALLAAAEEEFYNKNHDAAGRFARSDSAKVVSGLHVFPLEFKADGFILREGVQRTLSALTPEERTELEGLASAELQRQGLNIDDYHIEQFMTTRGWYGQGNETYTPGEFAATVAVFRWNVDVTGATSQMFMKNAERWGADMEGYPTFQAKMAARPKHEIDDTEYGESKYGRFVNDRMVQIVGDGVYRATQKSLADMGFGPDDRVQVHRGVKSTDLELGDRYLTNPMSSFSAEQLTAKGFTINYGRMMEGSAVITSEVPVKKVFSISSVSGFGEPDEREIVVLGHVNQVDKIEKWNDPPANLH